MLNCRYENNSSNMNSSLNRLIFSHMTNNISSTNKYNSICSGESCVYKTGFDSHRVITGEMPNSKSNFQVKFVVVVTGKFGCCIATVVVLFLGLRLRAVILGERLVVSRLGGVVSEVDSAKSRLRGPR